MKRQKQNHLRLLRSLRQMYNDSYGYTAMHAKPVAKLNPLRRKDESK